MKIFSSLSFRTRLLALILVFAMVPILVIVVVLYDTQTKASLEKNQFYQSSNNIMFSDLFDGYFYRTVVSDLVVLSGRREKLRLISQAIMDATNMSEESDVLGRSSIIRNIIFESANYSGLMPFIFDKQNPIASSFARTDHRHLLKCTNIFGQKLEELLQVGKFHSPGTFHVLVDRVNGDVFLLNITEIDDRHLLVIGELQNDLKTSFSDVKKQIIDALNNVMNADGRKLSANKSLLTYIVDSDGIQVAPKLQVNSEPLILDEAMRSKAKNSFNTNGSASFERRLNGIDYQMLVSYYNQMNLYIVSATPVNDILNAQRNETNRFLIIGFIVGLAAIFIAMVLVYDLVKPLSLVTRNTRQIANLDLRDIVSVRHFINRFDMEREDEVGEISTAIAKMTTKLSSNICNLLETQDRQRKIEGELNTAKDIQLGILPDNLDSEAFVSLKLSGKLIPAKEVGGDLYDVIALDDDNVAFVIGDVSDKGVPAALFMVMTVTIIRECFSLKMSPATVINEVNKVLCSHNPNMMFVTLFIAVLNTKTGAISFANGGHCPPVICHSNKISLLEGLSGPAPGVAPDFVYKEFSCTIEKNTRLFLYTDGVSEAQNEGKELFGENRINSCVMKYSSLEAVAFSETMLNEIQAYRGTAPQSDDITMLVIDF